VSVASVDVDVDDDALFCALVLAPTAFARNRFFGLFEQPSRRRLRRRATRVRGIIRQLMSPERGQAEIIGERVLDDGRLILRYTVAEMGFSRTAALWPLEAAVLRYALFRAGRGQLFDADRRLVEDSLVRLSRGLGLSFDGLSPS
jgi:hypothetical protein